MKSEERVGDSGENRCQAAALYACDTPSLLLSPHGNGISSSLTTLRDLQEGHGKRNLVRSMTQRPNSTRCVSPGVLHVSWQARNDEMQGYCCVLGSMVQNDRSFSECRCSLRWDSDSENGLRMQAIWKFSIGVHRWNEKVAIYSIYA